MKLRPRLTYANVVSSLCLFLLLGDAAYAATRLPRNSVGAAQLKKNAVNSSKVENHSLRAVDFAAGQLPAGSEGKEGPRGAEGPRGETGAQGPPGPFPDPLASGETLRGLWGHTWTATAGSQADNDFYSYGGFTLSTVPTPHYVSAGETAPAGCAGGSVGEPKAEPGNLCVYELDRTNTEGQPHVCSIDACPGASEYGFQIALESAASGLVLARGTWAVTAP